MLLKCLLHHDRSTTWLGPDHIKRYFELKEADIFGHYKWWYSIAYTNKQSVIHTLPHRNRLKIITGIQTDELNLQIVNASISDEGLYYCYGKSLNAEVYILKMISK